MIKYENITPKTKYIFSHLVPFFNELVMENELESKRKH